MPKINRRLVYLFLLIFGAILIFKSGFKETTQSIKKPFAKNPVPEIDEEEKCYYDDSCSLPQMLFRIRTETEKWPPFACLNDIRLFDNSIIEQGINVAVLNGSDGDILIRDTFDVKTTDEKFMKWLIALPHAAILVVASFGDVAEHVSRDTRQILAAFGASEIDNWRGGSAYILIGQRGIAKREAKERISPFSKKSGTETKIVNLTSFGLNRGKKLNETVLAEISMETKGKTLNQGEFKMGIKWKNCGMTEECEDDTIPIHLFSGEQKDDNPKMCIGGKMIFDKGLNNAGRGLNLAILEPKTAKIKDVKRFDTYQDESKNLEEWLDAIPTGYIIVGVSFDEASNMLSEMAKRILYEMGSSMIERLKFRAAWYFVGQKGIGAYSPFEDLNIPTGNTWATPVRTSICLPKSLIKKAADSLPNDARNLPKRHFCAKYDRHEEFCDSENLDTPIIPKILQNEKRQNEAIFNVPIIIAAGLAPDSLRATLETLIKQEGINMQMVLVCFDKEYMESADLAALFHVKSVAISAGADYNAHLLSSMSTALSIFPDSDSFIVIEEDVQLSDDWLFYFSTIYSTFIEDKNIDFALALNPNGFVDSSGEPSTIYRIQDQQPIGSYIIKRDLYEKHIRLREFCCLEHRNWDLRPSTSLVPALSRISITGYLLDKNNVLFSRERIASTSPAKLTAEYINVEYYQKFIENILKTTPNSNIDEILNIGCEKWKTSQKASKVLKFEDVSKLEQIFDCLKLYHTPKLLKNNRMKTSIFFFSLLTALFSTISCQKEEYKIDLEECKAAGFEPETLKCSTCEKLTDFNLETLLSDCLGCCTKEEEFKHKTYPVAFLEVCECNLARFPQVQAFVHKDMASQWNGKVKVRHVRGVRPQVVLKDLDGVTKETLSVEQWDTDTLIDFFNQWID
ncbi:unnamed protein product [Caenorhabditis angaria]|uniref:ILEI/PANDER domain-containing protein n=1 Tax=Caenorhabditis angaria TaxID=860376 RepID=A0A9P1N4T0_9PELO|nr:unnamed protein product [Caenorhabditis angaria]